MLILMPLSPIASDHCLLISWVYLLKVNIWVRATSVLLKKQKKKLIIDFTFGRYNFMPARSQ